MLATGSKNRKIAFLSEFYEKRYSERNYKFRANDVSASLSPRVLENLLIELTLYTNFRIMKFQEGDGGYFIICKI